MAIMTGDDHSLQKPTIEEVVKTDLCTGCATCVSICPSSAIELTKNDTKGIYIPKLNEEKCNNCEICYKVCPGHSIDFKEMHLEIFGKEPSKEILKLARDNSVVVTGYVEDMRPYLARASVITLPIHGFGIKTRLLEAMAMGKPVVISSEGIHGIEVSPGENIIVADGSKESAERVVELLNNEELREKIGTNARKLMEDKYSWKKMADMLNEVSQKVVNKR